MSGLKTALIAGGSGLIGSACVRLLLDHPAYGKVVAVGRRPLELSHPKLEEKIVAFDALGAVPMVAADVAFCGLGLTMAKAGSKEAFYAVDHDAVMNFAYWARGGGADCFCVVSSVGADPDSANFYLQTKGRVETGLKEQFFPRLHVFRPSVLLGERKEFRFLESTAALLLPLAGPAMVGPLRKYRAVRGDAVAAAMVAAAQGDQNGAWVHHYSEIVDAATR